MLLYIHIPFCESKCPYCNFGSVVGEKSLANDYFNALCDDLNHQIKALKNPKFSSVFIGGGTPSVIDFNFYTKLFEIFKPFLQEDCEITAEANPNSASLAWLLGMRNLGVNRISFGAQSFFADKLEMLGRTHGANDVKIAVQNAKIAGFNDINVDLIYSTRLDNKKRLEKEILSIKELGVTHISAYSLTLEENTPFAKKDEYKKDSAYFAKFLISEIEKSGFKQYEISNFGKICKHNLGYWQGDEYIGVGAYSVGFYDKKRHYAAKNLKDYIKNPTLKEVENLSDRDLMLEHIFLGARSIAGIDKNRLDESALKNAEFLAKSKKISQKNGKFYVKNFLLADEIALFISNDS
ncbi:radical SAM family heme chaperone HemW [Campylobacter gastrosuis]|uniref:Heme chaperone HemW n=1 Tax=Campylobacter gastrosuis TaxID=2974576 RepID=A0ABT7HQY0_9BACT|nr:radical SAM family heme chaperone HemW [Campylobacter gastrosuis]MDL0089117.1 radical SAM family heme chaperone HemW [Campylobacter gastrosuis]